ncbi:MAG TPA: DUF1223 domain-containing protein [Candidatus Acidoferrales bacterium]|nr:DUF1223 domain-containing protein [Candidatus Acidoferrales bacterium]
MRNVNGRLAGPATILFFLIYPAIVSRAQTQAPAAPSTSKPVVVELFTSEGCSTCPPADALLQRMEKQPLPGVEIITLEEHVDYWNQQGWIDPYSSVEWTTRQREYEAKAGSNDPYTPEMVVDGESRFTGSNGREAQMAIEKAVAEPKTSVSITPAPSDSKNSESFQVSVGKLVGSASGNDAEVWLAITEDGLHSSVTAGENAGHALTHAAVLRSLHKIGVAAANKESDSFAGVPKVKLNSSWKRENLRVIVFVQDKKSLKILGAASAKITS